jgi:hypothetical protein
LYNIREELHLDPDEKESNKIVDFSCMFNLWPLF